MTSSCLMTQRSNTLQQLKQNFCKRYTVPKFYSITRACRHCRSNRSQTPTASVLTSWSGWAGLSCRTQIQSSCAPFTEDQASVTNALDKQLTRTLQSQHLPLQLRPHPAFSHVFTSPTGKMKRTVALHLLNAARQFSSTTCSDLTSAHQPTRQSPGTDRHQQRQPSANLVSNHRQRQCLNQRPRTHHH